MVASSETPYRVESANGCVIVEFLPAMNEVHWSDIEKAGNDLLGHSNSSSVRGLMVDLSALNYMGSAMVALIVRLWKAAKARDGRMVIVNRDESVMSVLRLAGLTKVWTIVGTREEALKKLGGTKAPEPTAQAAEQGPALIMTILEVVGLIGGAIGLALVWSKSESVSQEAAKAILFLFGGGGLFASVTSSARSQGGRRWFDLLAALASLGIVLAGIFKSGMLQ